MSSSEPTTNSKGVFNIRDVSRDVFSATLGSVFCCYTGQPFDTVKVRIQTTPQQYHSVFQTTAKIVTEEGIAALWKGAVPTALGMAAENAMAFGVNEALKRAFPDENKGSLGDAVPNLAKPFAMGMITGFCSAMVLLPSEVVKAKTQVVIGSGMTSGDIVRKMFKEQGVRSMFTGLDSQLTRDGVFYALFFGSYELNCYLFRTYIPSMPDELNYFMSGGFAGMLGWTFAIPFDVPKTNVQSRWDTRVVGSYIPIFVEVYRQRGWSGFFHGLGPTLLRAFPANAALFLGVEMGKRFFDAYC